MQVICKKLQGFSLVELLVALAVVVVLAALALAVSRTAITSAQRAQCASQLRQIGVALLDYGNDHGGEFPLTSHSLSPDQQEGTWLHTLEPYLNDLDEVRICPADPRGKERLAEGGTSYILNSFLVVPKVDPFGRPSGISYSNRASVPSPLNTPIAFPINFSKGLGAANDHTHSENWTNWQRLRADIQPDAFGGAGGDGRKGDANYLFVDGSVRNIKARELQEQISSGYNFADPAATAR